MQYHDAAEERIYVVDGKATLIAGASRLQIGPGDAVSIPRGYRCTWNVTEPILYRYANFDAHGKIVRDDPINCDRCGEDCWAASWFLHASQEDLCPRCYAAGNVEGGEYQEKGQRA